MGLTDDERSGRRRVHDVLIPVYTVDDIRAVFGDKVAALVASNQKTSAGYRPRA